MLQNKCVGLGVWIIYYYDIRRRPPLLDGIQVILITILEKIQHYWSFSGNISVIDIYSYG